MGFRATALGVLVLCGCTFDPAVTPDALFSCASTADCPGDRVCALNMCHPRSSPCILVDGDVADVRPDGSICGDGEICVGGACVTARCGDSFVAPGEACDDGDANDDTTPNACRTDCRLAGCGDGVTDRGEICDDGNDHSGDGCRGDCAKVELCGDRAVDDGEDCDDGNANPVDGCDACGTTEWRAALVVSGSPAGRTATSVTLETPLDVAVDRAGRTFIAEFHGHRVRRLDPDGSLTTVAGTGAPGSSGDGGPSTGALLTLPRSVVADARGQLFIAEDRRIRRVEVDGTISTWMEIAFVRSLALDRRERLHLAVGTTIQRIETDGSLTTVAGGGSLAPGDGLSATQVSLTPVDLAFDAEDGLFIADAVTGVLRVTPDGTITMIGGAGAAPPADGEPAAAALLPPGSLAVDGAGRAHVVSNAVVWRVNHDGTLQRVAGNGEVGGAGDGGPAASAQLRSPAGLAIDAAGAILIADSFNFRIRRVAPDGVITTVAGRGAGAGDGDGAAATSAELPAVGAVALDRFGRLYIADAATQRIRRVDAFGTITTIAGGGAQAAGDGTLGDGGPATDAVLAAPAGLAVDSLGRVYVADREHARVRRIDADGTITTVAGTGVSGSSGDGGPATSAQLSLPSSLAIDSLDRLYIGELGSLRIRRVDTDGTITRFGGTHDPHGLAFDSADRLFVANYGSPRIDRVDPDGTVTVVAGTGVSGVARDGQPALTAELSTPSGVAVDPSGRVLFTESFNHRLLRVEADGTIRVLAGIGRGSLSGDGGPGTSAGLFHPVGVATDTDGRIFIADSFNKRVRRLNVDGTMATVAGLVDPPGPGPFEQSALYAPRALVSAGPDRLFATGGAGRVMRLDVTNRIVDVVAGYDPALLPNAPGRARTTPLLAEPRGLAVDGDTLLVVEQQAVTLRAIDISLDDAEHWTISNVPLPLDAALRAPAGVAFDDARRTLVVADEGDHCIKRLELDSGAPTEVIAGECGVRGIFQGLLDGPTNVAISPVSGAIYVSDTGNHKVHRIGPDGLLTTVVGDGSASSAGEGAPARLFPIDSPGQLAVDALGNLFVTSRTTVRMVANVDGDDDADGEDRVFTIYGTGDRLAFPESASLCLSALAVVDVGHLEVADACQGFIVELRLAASGRGP